MCSFYARSVKMSFRIKICYSEIYRKSYYLSIQRGHILPYSSVPHEIMLVMVVRT